LGLSTSCSRMARTLSVIPRLRKFQASFMETESSDATTEGTSCKKRPGFTLNSVSKIRKKESTKVQSNSKEDKLSEAFSK
jgi:hypothetical protein